MDRFSRVIGNINEGVGKFLTILALIIMVLICTEVVLRYVFNSPTAWAMPMSQLLFGAVAILGGGWALRHGEHVNMDMFYKRFSLKRRALVDLLTSAFFFLFCGVLLWKGAVFAWMSVMVGETYRSVFQPPVYPFKLLIPLAAILIILQGVVKFRSDISVLRKR